MLVLLALIALCSAGIGYWYLSTRRMNVILVTLDTTRADRLGTYGYQQGLTESFDELSRQGVVFDLACATAPITLPSHATMLTGLYPPEHGLRANGVGRLDDSIPLLPEILKQHGFDTGAFIAATVLSARYGLNRGFDTYDDDLSKVKKEVKGHHGEARRDGQDVMSSALNWLKKRTARPFFCWVHLYDAHAAYDPRTDVYGDRFEKEPYDAGIAWELQQVDRLTEFLKETDLDSNTLVIVAGDHGEGLGDHNEIEHGMLVYNSTLHVPLVFTGTKHCRPGTRVRQAVSLADITPTLLELLRIPPPGHLSGKSLCEALAGNAISERFCYAEAETPFYENRWAPVHAVVSSQWKYIRTTRPELYDIRNDPGELNNLLNANPEESQDLKNTLELIQEAFVVMGPQNVTLSEKELANLRSLGYLSGGTTPDVSENADNAESLPDVKDMLPLVARFEKARDMSMEGQLDAAIVMLKEIVNTTDDYHMAELRLADCLAEAGRMEEAVTAYRALLTKRSDIASARFNLGRILSSQGQHLDAIIEFREYLKGAPDSAPVYFELAQSLTRLKNFDEAVSAYESAIRTDPTFVAAHVGLGQILAGLRRQVDAIECFRQAAKFATTADEHAQLMILMTKIGRSEEAIEIGRKAVRLAPDSFEHHFNLGILLVQQSRITEGLAELEEARRLNPNEPRLLEQIQRANSNLNMVPK